MRGQAAHWDGYEDRLWRLHYILQLPCTGRLAARGIRTLVDMTVPELEAEGLTHNEAQYGSLRKRGMLTVWGPIFNKGPHTNKMRLICSRYRYRQPI